MKSLIAYEKIRDMILSGIKRPGTRLILSELEEELGIGRGPIREALMRLDRSGARSGYRVRAGASAGGLDQIRFLGSPAAPSWGASGSRLRRWPVTREAPGGGAPRVRGRRGA